MNMCFLRRNLLANRLPQLLCMHMNGFSRAQSPSPQFGDIIGPVEDDDDSFSVISPVDGDGDTSISPSSLSTSIFISSASDSVK